MLRRKRLARGVGRVLVAGTALLAGAAAAGCGGSAGALAPSRILRAHRGLHRISLLLVAGEDSAFGGFNFDGYGAGQMTVVVPLGWRVDVTCKNASNALTHSCAVVRGGARATRAGPVVFGAASPDRHGGLPIHSSATFSFLAARAGRYRIADLVTAHEADGDWDWLLVRRGATPAVRTSSSRSAS